MFYSKMVNTYIIEKKVPSLWPYFQVGIMEKFIVNALALHNQLPLND